MEWPFSSNAWRTGAQGPAPRAAPSLALGLMLGLSLLLAPASGLAQTPPVVRVAVLSVVEDDLTQRDWAPLQQGLAQALPARRFEFLPLTPQQIDAAVAEASVDYVVTNPGHYVALEARFGVTRLATQNADEGEDAAHAVGSAVVMRADAAPLEGLQALRGRRVASVGPDAFGGHRVVAAEWLKLGLDAESGQLQMLHTGYPMTRVVDAVLAGQADAGILRTCLLEQLERSGRLLPGRLRVVGELPRGSLDCRRSTPLYPGWAFAASAGAPRPLTRELLLALLQLQSPSGSTRWSAPADYQRVHEVLRALQAPPYQYLRETGWQSLARRYWFVPALLLLIGLLHAAYTWRVENQVRRRTAELTRTLQERDRLARQLERDHEALDHLSRLSILGELSATLGHELRQPLGTIANYAAALRRRSREGRLDAAALEPVLDEIGSEAERAAGVLDGIRALARRRVARRQRTDPGVLVERTVALFRGMTAQAPEVQVRNRLGEEPLWIDINPMGLQQVLLNLLKNALDVHRAEGLDEAPIELHLERSGDNLALTVVDRGPPLAAAVRDRLFEPFFTTKPEGLGLGLSICRSIIEAHGGGLRADAADSRGMLGGMAFQITLPLAQGPEAATAGNPDP